MRSSQVRGAVLLAAALPLMSCGGSDGGTDGGDDMLNQVTSVSVSPGTTTLDAIGATVTLTATAKDGNGNTLPGAAITWSSSDEAIVQVSTAGVVTARANGSATITATGTTAQAEASGTAAVTVAQKTASVALTAPADTLQAGQTMQLSAQSADAGGTPIGGVTYTWTSSDEAVATVDDAGLVTAVGAGNSTLAAAADGARGEADLTVLFVSVSVANDTTLGGTVVVDTFNVAAGVTVTTTEDFFLQATGPVTVEGTITGDCVGLSLEGQSTVTISGTLSNACADASAEGGDVSIQANGALNLEGVSISTSGEVNIGNAGASASPVSGQWSGMANISRATVAESPCFFRSVAMTWNPKKAPKDRDGKDLGIKCLGTATFYGGNGLQAQHGGDGGDDVHDSDAEGNDGNEGGSVRIEVVEGNMVFMAESHDGVTGTELVAGDGGDGGDAEAIQDDSGGDADAEAGDGGEGGAVSLQTLNGSIKVMEFNGLSVVLGRGGDGGDAEAVGADGADAGAAAAQAGGYGDAVGGDGGGGGTVQVAASGGAFEGETNIVQRGGRGGRGGDGDATGGKGGDGNAAFPDGAKGGAVTARGGDGADGSRGHNANFLGDGGSGGDTYLAGARGGMGASLCPSGNGGNGGMGGDADGLTGDGGDGVSSGSRGDEDVSDHTSDGGDGGNGLMPGKGGAAGEDDTEDDWPDAFHDGVDGSGCVSQATLGVSVSVNSDPAGHNPFVGMGSVSSLNVTIDGTSISITGSSPWINVQGTTDGTSFTASGSGNAAGFSNVGATFEGTVTRDGNGNLTGISGVLTVGVNGELFGVPISYNVSG